MCEKRTRHIKNAWRIADIKTSKWNDFWFTSKTTNLDVFKQCTMTVTSLPVITDNSLHHSLSLGVPRVKLLLNSCQQPFPLSTFGGKGDISGRYSVLTNGSYHQIESYSVAYYIRSQIKYETNSWFMMHLLYTWRTQANERKKELIQSQKCWWCCFQLRFGQWGSVL